MTIQASLTATIAYSFDVHYVTDDNGTVHRRVDAWPVGGFTIDPTTLELQPKPVLRHKRGDHITHSERKHAKETWRVAQADQLVRAVETLIALSPRILERMRQLEQANKPTDEARSHE